MTCSRTFNVAVDLFRFLLAVNRHKELRLTGAKGISKGALAKLHAALPECKIEAGEDKDE